MPATCGSDFSINGRGPSTGLETWIRIGRQYSQRDSVVKADAYMVLLSPYFSMAPVTRRSTVWRRVGDVVSAARPRWRVFQTIRNRAEPRYFTTKEESHGQSAEVKIEVEVEV